MNWSRRNLLLFSILLCGCSQEATPPVAAVENEAPVVAAPESSGVITVYATGDTAQLAQVLDAYRAETGIRSKVLVDQAAPPDLVNHPESLPLTDLFVGASLAEIWAVAEADKLRPTYSDQIRENIPAHLRDPESRWAGLSVHAQIVVYHPEAVLAAELAELQSYAALGEGIWRDRLCLSSSRLAGNQSLVAFLIHQHGLRETEVIVRKWRANFGPRIYADDAELLKAIAAGDCALGVAASSTYEVFRRDRRDAQVAAHWFDADATLLLDFRAVGVSRHATEPGAAAELMEWLATKDANALFALQRLEFPANPAAVSAVALAPGVERMRQEEALSELGFLQEDARKLIERAKYP